MNRKLKLIALGLVFAGSIASPNVEANCLSSGVIGSIGLLAQYVKIKQDYSNLKNGGSKQEKEILKQLKELMANLMNKQLATKNTYNNNATDREAANSVDWNGYTQQQIAAVTSNTELPKDSTKITLKYKKFKSDNPTQYRVISSGNTKYNANGLIDNNGTAVTDMPVLSQAGFLADSDLRWQANFVGNNGTQTNVANNYTPLEKISTGNEIARLVPRDEFILNEMNKTMDPTHMRVADAGTQISNYLNAVYNNDTTQKDLRDKLGFTGDKANGLLKYGNDLFLNTVDGNKVDWDSFIDSSASTVQSTQSGAKTIGDVDSKLGLDIIASLGYQHRIFDWIIRGELFGVFPVLNRTVSLMKSSTSDNKANSKDKSSSKNSDDYSVTRQFEVGFNILGGYSITQNFTVLVGGGVVYSKYVLNNIDKLYDLYKLGDFLSSISTNNTSINDWQKNYGNDGSKNKSLGNWSFRLILGGEYNIGNFVVSMRFFWGPTRKIMKATDKNPGSIESSNCGGQLLFGYKF